MQQFLKAFEIGFRRLLIGALKVLAGKRALPPQSMDYNVCRFLFVRQDRIGDVLVSTPLWGALKRHYPNAVVDMLLSTNNHFVVENDPCIRKRWIYDKGVLSSWKLLRQIRAEHYDFVIDLMDNPSATSTVVCLLAGARWTVGLEKENAYAYDIVVPLISRRDAHIVDRIAQLLTPFNIVASRENLRIRYTVPKPALEFAKAVFNGSGLGSKPALGVNISAGHDVRFWGVDNFRALIGMLQEKHRRQGILVLYKPSQKQLAEEITEGFDRVVASPPTHSFDEFAALIKHLRVLITPDTSAVHLAAAFGVPSVVMYVQSDKNLRIWDPYRTRSEVLIADVDNLRVISPIQVFEATERLLLGKPHRRRRSSHAAVTA